MTVAHVVLLIMAGMMALEALWAIVTPDTMRQSVRRLLDEADPESVSLPPFFWGLALLCWLCAWFGNQWAHRALFFIGVFFMIIGFLARRVSLIEFWYGLFLGRRSLFSIRLIYCAELIIAFAFAWIGWKGL